MQMRPMKEVLRSFVKDRAGSYATAVAVMIFPVVGSIGAAIDYSSFYNLRSDLQNAVDAAAIAAAKEFTTSLETKDLKSIGEKHFTANYNGEFDDGQVTFDLQTTASTVTNSSGEAVGFAVRATASTDYEYVFGKFLGLETSNADVSATVNIANKTIEAAFVFDASGSMTDNDTFKKSTKAAHDMLHDLKQFALQLSKITGSGTSFAKYALVPFAWGVNVGASNKGATWLDNDGLAKHHHQYFDWNEGYTNATQNSNGWKAGSTSLNRFKLYDDIGENWGGCVDARAYPYNLDDTSASIATPDTLFVPMFAPDEPDNWGGGEKDYANSFAQEPTTTTTTTSKGKGKKSTTTTTTTSSSGSPADQYDRMLWTSKYTSSGLHSKNKQNNRGPNRNCFEYEIYPLNNNFGLTNAEIAHLNNTFASSKTIGSGDDDGATNIQQGVVWGWRTLSSSAPFTEGRPESDTTNQKVMIVITDGINSYSSSSNLTKSEYGAYGYLADSWIDDAVSFPAGKTTSAIMDEITLESCTKAKNDGINIYVVGYGVIQGSAADSMLASCSGGQQAGEYYFRVNDASISDAMTNIMRQLVDLRLTS